MSETRAHTPVLLREIVEAIAPRDGGIYVDGTFGAGGYSRALLDAADCRVWAIDRDPEAVARGAPLIERYGARLVVLLGRFGEMDALLAGHGVEAVDGVALDLGVSSPQLETAERGFSFRLDGPLDMRMERAGPTAAEIVNGAEQDALADILYVYGEERLARRIARAIVDRRRDKPILRTGELAALVRRVYGARARSAPIDPATRTFQALRIYLNDELGELERGLEAAETLLRPGGRLAVVTFHSLEDRTVKTFFDARAGRTPRGSRHAPEVAPQRAATFRLLGRRGVTPSAVEIAANPRARSARLRVGERIAEAAA